MKKLLLILILLLIISFSFAQQRFNLTFLASPQISWLKSDSPHSVGGRSMAGFGYGVEGDIFLGSENYAISTGMTVSSGGGSLMYNTPIQFSGKMLPAGTNVDFYLTYLEFPVALKMRTRNFNRTRFFAQFGLTNWINIKAKATSNDSGRSFQKESVKDEVRFLNLGLNVGTGLEYDLGHGNALTAGLIYSNGFTDATTNGTIRDATTLKVVRFRMGFVF
jgi:hypothetical protein